MIKIVTIIGARPQIIKAAALSRAIKNSFSDKIQEVIVHTGQHYDHNMSEVFFEELGIPKPNYNLNIGSLSHGKQTAKMIEGIEEILITENPQAIVLYGDTNSTLAGTIAASKIHVPIVHIEAGLRSFNKKMPEEINRIMCDHSSTLLFSPTQTGIKNLEKEGFDLGNKAPISNDNPGVFHCGDIMFDNSLYFSDIAEQKSDILSKFNLSNSNYILSTLHRNNNTDDPERLTAIFSSLIKISEKHHLKVILPLHPRTKKILTKNLSKDVYDKTIYSEFIQIIEPVSFLEMIQLEKNASLVMTDSGGVQKEAYFFNKPVLVLRSESEWIEIIEVGAGIICDANENKILDSFQKLYQNKELNFDSIFGDGKAAEFICQKMFENFT
jgi:UDP-GlcNAc3NAcA epimerase